VAIAQSVLIPLAIVCASTVTAQSQPTMQCQSNLTLVDAPVLLSRTATDTVEPYYECSVPYAIIAAANRSGDREFVAAYREDMVSSWFSRQKDPLGLGLAAGSYFRPANSDVMIGAFTSIDVRRETLNSNLAGSPFLGSTTSQWVVTTGIRVGMIASPGVFLYGLTGVSVLNKKLDVNFGGSIASDATRVPGFTVGFGGEFQPAILQAWGRPMTLFMQYQRTWWGDATLNTWGALPFTYNIRQADDTFRFGLNIYLNGTAGAPSSAPSSIAIFAAR